VNYIGRHEFLVTAATRKACAVEAIAAAKRTMDERKSEVVRKQLKITGFYQKMPSY